MVAPASHIPTLTVVVPTFNEKENVRPLVDMLEKALKDQSWEVVFVDDDSPDGTAEEVREMSRENPKVRVLQRIGRRGLAGACIEGIQSSLSPFCAVMDADLQHDETRLPDMLQVLKEDDRVDVAIGTRNGMGGSVGEGLSRIRKWGSSLATYLARRFLKIEASDPMSGFFMVRRSSFDQVAADLQASGFKILADMLSSSRGSWTIREVGFTFRERRFGQSKMDSAVTLEFLGLLLARFSGGLMSIRFILFCFVGLSGVLVQLLGVKLSLLFVTQTFEMAQVLGIALAITSNFTLNNRFTFRDMRLKGLAFWQGLLSFFAVCSVGAIVNFATAAAVYSILPIWSVASASGAIIGAIWNFFGSSRATWRASG